MQRCVIVTALFDGSLEELYSKRTGDCIICADGGYPIAVRLGLKPDMVLGDFDSCKEEDVVCDTILRVSREKDDTDTMLCLKYGMVNGCREFLILGGMGGRLDHTVANLQTLAFAQSCGVEAVLADGNNEASILGPGMHTSSRRPGWKLSLFSYTSHCSGVTISGVKYPLVGATLTNTFPLGVSNEFVDEAVLIEHTEGLLLLIESREKQ
ncbi:MAG: thiamine diphosphokinase [Eubacteriales bacterium]|nr:thiamine diphosphokinase [Eubacteriales bacterium]